jgi:hypothetical protein
LSGGRHHNVNVYDPAQLEPADAAQRFLGVWRSVFAALPLKASW